MVGRGTKQEIGQLIKPLRDEDVILKFIGICKRANGEKVYIYVHHSGNYKDGFEFLKYPEEVCLNMRIPYGSIPFSNYAIDYSDEKEGM